MRIPVWHDDAQGTACVTLAGLINALKVVGKDMSKVKITFFGAGASNTTIVRLIMAAGGDPENIVVCDSKGGLHKDRKDIEADKRFYRKWEICQETNPKKINSIEDAMKGADVLIALSTPGPDVIKPAWVSSMARGRLFSPAPTPFLKFIPMPPRKREPNWATGRGDFPNQVNNSLGFPGILKGALIVQASKITDEMAIAAAYPWPERRKRGASIPKIFRRS